MNNIEIFGIPYFKKGSGIHIKEENKGKFTASAKAAGQSVQEHARSVLNNPNATPLQKKRANFARNAAKWKHEEGAKIHKPFGHRSILDNGWQSTKLLKDKKNVVPRGKTGTFSGFWEDSMYHPDIAAGNPTLEAVNERNYVGEVKQLPYADTVRFIRNLENPKEKKMINGVAKPYDSRTAGYGTDFVSGHPELANKIKSGKWTILEAKDLAVTDMRKHDNVIMENLKLYTTRPDTISQGPRLLAAQARYHHGNIRKNFDRWAKAIATGDAQTLKDIALDLAKGYNDRSLKIQDFNIYGL